MPLYILCSRCERVPVTKIGEWCEECQRQHRKNQWKQDELAKLKLERDTKKKTSLKNWLENWAEK